MVQCLLTGDPVPFALTPKVTNERSLYAAVKYASVFLIKAVKPVLVGGVKMRWPGKAQDAFLKLSEAGEPLKHPFSLIKLLKACELSVPSTLQGY